MTYRSKIYEKYASRRTSVSEALNRPLASGWGRSYDYYLAGWLPSNKEAAVLDLACGSGALLHFFAERGFENLSGVDLSLEQVKLAQQVVPTVEHGDLTEYLVSRSASFDLITGLDIIEHLHKHEVFPFLEGCLKALRPGGRLVLQTPNGESPFVNGLRYGDFTHEVCFTPDSLSWLLGLCGFRSIESRPAGPVPSSARSALRLAVWKGLSLGLTVWNIVEMGSAGSGIYTRVFLASAVRGSETD